MKKRSLLALSGALALLLVAGSVAAFIIKRQSSVIPVRLTQVTRVERLEALVCMSGELRAPSRAKLTRVPQAAPLEAVMLVNETDLLKLKVDQAARIHVGALHTTEPLAGKISEIGASPVQPVQSPPGKGRDFKVVLALDTLPASLKLGMSCAADVTVAERERPLVIPISALTPRQIGSKEVMGVFLEGEDGKAHFREVRTGLLGDMNVELLVGLKEGEMVITGPLMALRGMNEGTRVRQETEADRTAAERRRQAEEKKAAEAKKKAEVKK